MSEQDVSEGQVKLTDKEVFAQKRLFDERAEAIHQERESKARAVALGKWERENTEEVSLWLVEGLETNESSGGNFYEVVATRSPEDVPAVLRALKDKLAPHEVTWIDLIRRVKVLHVLKPEALQESDS